MKAWVIRDAGGPQQFQLEDISTPDPRKGWALIRIRAFGLNRSEWFTRIGDSPTVMFPRVLGIECVGEIVDAGGLDFAPGTKVAAIMGGMGREFDGSYAEYTLVPHECVFVLNTELPWEKTCCSSRDASNNSWLITCRARDRTRGITIDPWWHFFNWYGRISIGQTCWINCRHDDSWSK